MNEELIESIVRDLIKQLGSDLLNRLGEETVNELAERIAEQKLAFDNAKTETAREKARVNISFLNATLLLRVERKKIRLSNKLEAVLKSAITSVIKAHCGLL